MEELITFYTNLIDTLVKRIEDSYVRVDITADSRIEIRAWKGRKAENPFFFSSETIVANYQIATESQIEVLFMNLHGIYSNTTDHVAVTRAKFIYN